MTKMYDPSEFMIKLKPILYGLALGVLYWVGAAFADSLFLKNNTFIDSIFPHSLKIIYTRFTIMVLIVMFVLIHLSRKQVLKEVSQIKYLNQELESSRANLTNLLDQSPLVFIKCGPPPIHKIIHVNEKAAELLGYTPQEFYKDDFFWTRRLHQEDRNETVGRLSEVAEERNIALEYQFRHKEGHYIWLHQEVYGEFDKNDKLTGLTSSWHDISDKKEMEKINKELTRFPEDNPCPVFRVLDTGELQYSNKACKVILDVWKISIGDDIPEDWKKLVSEIYRSNLTTNREVTVGDLIYECAFVPIKEKGYLNIYCADITNRIEASKFLTRSEIRTKALLDSSLYPVVASDHRGKIILASSSVEKVFGWNPAELIGQNVKVLMPEPYHSEHDGYFGKYYKTGKENLLNKPRVLQGKRKDGSVFLCEVSLSRALIEETNEVFFTATLKDLSKIKDVPEKTATCMRPVGS